MLWTLLTVVCVLAFFLILYLFCLLPRLPRRPLTGIDRVLYAHRGLWNGTDAPENSLLAFRRAVDAGFGIELDVQRSADGELVVFHDENLERLCGLRRPVALCSLNELRAAHLQNSAEVIPTLQEVLREVNGAVPLMIEIKPVRRIREMTRQAAALLLNYPGAYCIVSFDPRPLLWFRRHRPTILRGQLACGLRLPAPKGTLLRGLFCESLVGCLLSRPDFLSLEAETDSRLPFRLARLFRPGTAVWPVRSQEQLDALSERYDLLIFDSFVPRSGRPAEKGPDPA